MTMWSDKGTSISTVIVMVVIGNLLFQPVGQEPVYTAKIARGAVASMASVAKCPLVRALALPEALLK